ncbi:polar residue-rich protein 6 [Diadegma semiclausum ichnovirus]|nr:polar residue-rich protein 6 [Diadegma semiclausum ichnovirus]
MFKPIAKALDERRERDRKELEAKKELERKKQEARKECERRERKTREERERTHVCAYGQHLVFCILLYNAFRMYFVFHIYNMTILLYLRSAIRAYMSLVLHCVRDSCM